MSKSDRIDLMVEIVRFCEPSRDKIRIMNKMSLNDVYTEAYLAILTRQKLLTQNDGKYLKTEEGKHFLAVHDKCIRATGRKVEYM